MVTPPPEVLIVGVAPARVIVPLEIVAAWLKVRLFAQTVPLTEGVAPTVLKTAALVPPLVTSHGAPVTFDQLVAVVSQAPAPPVQVAVAAWITEGRDAATMAAVKGVMRKGFFLAETAFFETGRVRREEWGVLIFMGLCRYYRPR